VPDRVCRQAGVSTKWPTAAIRFNTSWPSAQETAVESLKQLRSKRHSLPEDLKSYRTTVYVCLDFLSSKPVEVFSVTRNECLSTISIVLQISVLTVERWRPFSELSCRKDQHFVHTVACRADTMRGPRDRRIYQGGF
jgi:hypothetical protein